MKSKSRKLLIEIIKANVQELPTWIQIAPTNICNLNCSMCVRNTLSLENKHMSRETYHKILARIDYPVLMTFVGNGEPLCCPHIAEMLAAAKQNRHETAITTNGTLLTKDRIESLLETRVDTIRVSMDRVTPDGTDQLHRYDTVVLKNLECLLGMREPHRTKVGLSVCVSRSNHRQVLDILRYARKVGVDFVVLLKIDARIDLTEKLPVSKEEKWFGKYHAEAENIGLDLRSTYVQRTQYLEYCPFLERFIFIDVEGRVAPCCQMPFYHVGNILEQNISEIWNSPKYEHFRKNFRKICGGCSLFFWDPRPLEEITSE